MKKLSKNRNRGEFHQLDKEHFQNSVGSSHCNKTTKGNKKHTNWKGKNKMVFVCR